MPKRLNLPYVVLTITLIIISIGCHHRKTQILDEGQVPTPTPQRAMSQPLQQSGEAKVGQTMPFFSGWTVSSGSSQAYSLNRALKNQKNRYVLTICASWCKPCLEGLQSLSANRQRFIQSDVEVIILVADQSKRAEDLNARFDLSWAKVIVDEFSTFALKLAPSESSSKRGSESLSLPRTILFSRDGLIEKIIGIEGRDYIDLLLSP